MTAITSIDRQWLIAAIELAQKCPPSTTAFSVGAIVVDREGREISRGYSRETDPHVHAEEAALAKLNMVDGPDLTGATIYSTLEPCSERRSRPRTCAQLIIEAGIPRVVIAWREPSLFVADCQGVELLASNGIEVLEVPDLAAAASAVGMPSGQA
ncbi:deaminase [Microbispora sp. H10836]|uniref:deaminase n=1 Tax=Microbispora sp. H10836 TaxID=2729106 RepID=UPI0014762F54|nr:deaminase [Microbispora sp. H10836]